MSGTTKQTGIYKIINLINGKFYIGSAGGKAGIYGRISTHESKLKRNKHYNNYLQSAWNKYGEENFKLEILEIIENKNIIIEREQYYLDLYKPYDRTIGYNLSPTAGSQIGYKHTKQTIYKISGRKCNEESKKLMSLSHIGKESTRKTRILQLDLDGNKIKTWESMAQIENELGVDSSKISEVCNNKRKSAGGYKWEYLDKDIIKKRIFRGITKVCQMDMSGNEIKIWNNANEAAKHLNINYHGIRNVCVNKTKTSGGFKWKFINKPANKKIYQLDLNNNIIKLWDDILIASKTLDINYEAIRMVCNGTRQTSGGFKWKFVN